MRQIAIIGILVLAFCYQLNAQDIHYSQFYLSPLNLNPALTGVFNGDMRFAANYRSQWSSIPVPYMTTSGSFDGKIFEGKAGNDILAGGLVFNYDQAGDSKMGLLQVGALIAYTRQITKRNFISLGFQGGAGQRRFHTDDLTFDTQFNGDIFDPNLGSNETFPRLSFFFLDFSVGLNWHFQLNERTKFDSGVAIHHINEPEQSFFENDEIRLAKKISFNWDATIQAGERVDVMPALIYQVQGTYQETILGSKVYCQANVKFKESLYASIVRSAVSHEHGSDVPIDDTLENLIQNVFISPLPFATILSSRGVNHFAFPCFTISLAVDSEM